ncbi:MAG: DUF1028 domain-containing protein, partial [Alphaproteobacteria bacterium]|nr:DUF1028 domain-containing protein [Alphaproteobacteria bacterium]
MTFSIVARDPHTGALGVATATAGPAVGALVPHGAAGLGAIATQAMTNPYLGIDCLTNLHTLPAPDAMAKALAADRSPEQRQFIVVDNAGRVAGWTGHACEPFAGHLLGDSVAVAGNMIASAGVLDAMLAGFAPDGPLATRLLGALKAGAQAGGDVRGTGSAALKVFERETIAAVDLRVDWSETPLIALEALL